MPEESFQERTEKATPKRIREAREKGQVARSQDLSAVIVMLCGVAALVALGPAMSRELRGLLTWTLGDSAKFAIDPGTAQGFLVKVGWVFVKATAPVILALTVIAFGSSYLQVGNVFSTSALEPKFDKLNFVTGAKNLLTLKSIVALARDVFKLTLIGLIAYYAIKKEVPTLVTFPQMSAGEIGTSMISISVRIAFKILMALLILAALDFAYQRYDYLRGLRMSRQDLKEEFKTTEGDPLTKGRIRSIQREQARRRMMQDVPKADVVITNPTHLAVALKYDADKMDAPTVIAKGERLVALAIKKIAQEAGIPIIENKPLAQALFKTVEIGMQVPGHLYRMVAEVLAYVYGLKGKGR
jgi:flagellar biosynthesis protein FlhB